MRALPSTGPEAIVEEREIQQVILAIWKVFLEEVNHDNGSTN
jgi:hypothetical protein